MRQPGIESPVLSIEALVVRTPDEWLLTVGERRAAARISAEELHALVRASGGAPLAPDDPARVALESVGVAFPAGATDVEAGPAATVAGADRVAGGSLRPEEIVAPVNGFVARVSAGCLLIEGLDGVRIALDEVDLRLIEAVRGAMTVAAVLETAATPDGSSASVDGDLGARLRRLVEVGRLGLVREPTAVEPEAPDQSAAQPPTGWKAFVRRHRFPGRRYLIRGYRRARRTLRGRGPQPSPDAPAAPAPTAPAATPPGAGDAAVDLGTEDLDIRSEEFLSTALSAQRDGVPFHATVVLGRPDHTVESLWSDLQFLIDHDIPARLSAGDARDELLQVRDAYLAFEHYGILRHVMRVIQWDHGVEATTFLRRLVESSRDDPDRYPLINWVVRYFGSFHLVPLGWRSFFNEVRRFLVDELEVPLTSALDSVLELQAFLLPESGRRFPATIPLEHDYVAYLADKTASLSVTGRAEPTSTPLSEYGPSTVTVQGDPQDRCTQGFVAATDARSPSGDWELDSPLVRRLAAG